MYITDIARTNTRAIDSLLVICSGITSDGIINDSEISYLKTWIKDNESLITTWPVNVIAERINSIIFDGKIDDVERSDLLSLLLTLTGTDFINTGSPAPDSPALPIDKNPAIVFDKKSYCFTGKFYFGTRALCALEVTQRGGIHIDDVTPKTDYLVIGSIINPNWAHSTFGRKIEAAVFVKQKHGRLIIISEKQWFDALIQSQ